MAGIPTYHRQIAPPDTVRGVNPTESGYSPIAQGIADIGRGLASFGADAERQLRIREQAEDKQATERAKVWAGEQAGQSMLTEMQTLDEAQRKAPPGADGFAKEYLKGFDERAATAVAAAPDAKSKAFLQQHVQAQRNHMGAVATDFQFKSGDADVVNRYSNAVDTWGKAVEQDPRQFGAAMKTLGETMPDVVPTARQKLVDHAKLTLTNAAAASVMNRDPYAVQDATSKAMGHNGFTGATGVPWVDQATPAQVKTWNDAATVKIRQIESQMGREVEARDRTAKETFTAAFDLANKGQYFDAPTQLRLLADTKGTAFEGEAQALIADQRNTAGFASGTATQRAASLNEMRGAGSDPARGTSPAMAKQVDKYATIDSAITVAVAKNPWEAATQYGVLKGAPVVPIANANDALKVAEQRLAAIAPVESWTGKKESPYQPEEAAQIASLLDTLPPPQAASFVGQLGAKIGNSERTAAFARQIHDKDGTLGLAMAYQATQTSEGRYASELLLVGRQRIKDGAIKVDGAKETGWKAQVAGQIRGAYANQQLEDQVVQAAFLMTAAKDGDVDNAVRLATGGGIIDFNGAKVPMPVGYAADGGQAGAEKKFRKAIESIPPEQLMPQVPDGKVYAGGVPVNASVFLEGLKDAQLVHAGHGRYSVKAGNSFVTNRDGRRITITLP